MKCKYHAIKQHLDDIYDCMNIGEYNMTIMKLIKDEKQNLSYRFVRYHSICTTLWEIKN